MHCHEQQGPQPLERPFVLKSCVPRDPQLGLRRARSSLSSCTDYHHLMSNPLLNELPVTIVVFNFAVIHISFASEALALAKFTPIKY